MQNEDNILAIYQSNKVVGRSEFCPRKGTYKIISIYQGICLKKPATMAKAFWKLDSKDNYTDHVFTIQLESFKTTLQPLNTENIVGREIGVARAEWFPSLLFAITWELLPQAKFDLEEVNRRLNENSKYVNLNENDKLPSVYIEEGKEAEYGNL